MNSGELDAYDNALLGILERLFSELETTGKIVICTGNAKILAAALYERLRKLVPNDNLSFAQLAALRSLILHAVDDKRFFDWEMQTLTGINADEFKLIAEKLPQG